MISEALAVLESELFTDLHLLCEDEQAVELVDLMLRLVDAMKDTAKYIDSQCDAEQSKDYSFFLGPPFLESTIGGTIHLPSAPFVYYNKKKLVQFHLGALPRNGVKGGEGRQGGTKKPVERVYEG